MRTRVPSDQEIWRDAMQILLAQMSPAKAIRDYKHVSRKHPQQVRDVRPKLRFGASYAILPCAIVSHYEYHIASLWGWGGPTVDFWCFTSSESLSGFTKWIS